MLVQLDFLKSNVKFEVNFMKEGVSLVFDDGKDKAEMLLSKSDFLVLQDFLSDKTDEEIKVRLKVMLENPNPDMGVLPGSLEEKVFCCNKEGNVR